MKPKLSRPASKPWPNRRSPAIPSVEPSSTTITCIRPGWPGIARKLQREHKIDELLRLTLRGGKSAGVNLGLSVCKGDIVIIADVDTTFDRDAFALILRHFADPRVGAVSGNLGARNASATLVTRHQAIEY